MKRFHVHVHVDDLARNISFYSTLFAAEPARVEADYAKWMLDDPPVNFAISARGRGTGIDHLGIQTEDPAELAGMKARAQAADLALFDEGRTTCCYAQSDKHWVTDPQGIAWEHFHTLANIPVFREEAGDACCSGAAPAPTRVAQPAVVQAGPEAVRAAVQDSALDAAAAGGCCGPAAKPRGKAIAIPVKAAGGTGGSCC